MTSSRKEFAMKEDLEKIKEEIFREFYVFYLRFTKEVNLIARSQPTIIERLRRDHKCFYGRYSQGKKGIHFDIIQILLP